MHILFLPSWYPASPEDVQGVFFRDQALALSNYGHQVGVVAPKFRSLKTLFGKAEPLAQSTPSYELDAGIPTYRKSLLAALPRVPYGNYWLFRRAARQLLKRYIDQHGKPDVLHAHCVIFGGAVAVVLGREHGIPVVLTEHSSGFARNRYAHWQLDLAQKGFAGACPLIAVSPALGDVLGECFPLSQGQWHWVPNVVSDRFNTRKSRSEKKSSTIFLNLALMTENKGQSDLVEAFQDVARSNPGAELWLAGDGPSRAALEKQAGELGISGSVRFLGMIQPEKVPALLEQADVMVISSHYETFGVVAAEALMAGLPVIATRCGGPECILERGDGLLVPVKDPGALAAAMLQMSETIDAFDSGTIATRAHVRFSGAAVARQLTDKYSQAINSFQDKLESA
ncbi:glycosyltransferase [Marinobacter halotolerans]|uniref:glycosyltransferase n=1 Tax=Marinobacter halotolerans TaxID=1569211 RepID=UPI001243D439|nr:glycosyltransferase [Marinobacter halotolerans]